MTRRGGYAWSWADYERERKRAERRAGVRETVAPVVAPESVCPTAALHEGENQERPTAALHEGRPRKLAIDLRTVPSGMELKAESWKGNR